MWFGNANYHRKISIGFQRLTLPAASACIPEGILHSGRSDDGFKMKEEYHRFRSQSARWMMIFSGALCALMWRSLHGSKTQAKSLSAKISSLGGSGVHLPWVAHHSFAPLIMVGVQVCIL
jgi:hypothetical protein